MSSPLSPEEILFHQRILRQDGLYHGELDGLWGPLTNAADEARVRLLSDCVHHSMHQRTTAAIETLTVAAARAAFDLEGLLLDDPEPDAWPGGMLIISGTRTYAEQEALYAKGRYGNPGKIVTKALPGSSMHNFGIAFDIGLFRADGSYIRDEEGPYREARKFVMAKLGDRLAVISWDLPHYHLRLPFGIAEVRRRFEKGIPWLQARGLQ